MEGRWLCEDGGNVGVMLPQTQFPEARRNKKVCSIRVYGESIALPVP